MNLLDSLAVGLRALSVNKMRSMLTVLGIIIGVAAVVCMGVVGSGAREEVSEKIRTLGANLVVIRPGAQLSGAARLETGTRQTLTEDLRWRFGANLPTCRPLPQRCRDQCKWSRVITTGQRLSTESITIISWRGNGGSPAAGLLPWTN